MDKLRSTLELDFSETMCVSHNVSMWGQTYRIGTVVLTKDKHDEVVFEETVHLFPQADKGRLVAFVKIVHVDFFDDHFYAVSVEQTEDFKMVKSKFLMIC